MTTYVARSYADLLKAALFGSGEPQINAFMMKLHSGDDVSYFYRAPLKSRYEGVNFARFSVGGFIFLVKLDQRAVSNVHAEAWLRGRQDMSVLAHIREHYSLSLGSYGRPRMTMELKEAGLAVGERRVGRLMRANGIKPVRTRKHKVTTDSHHRLGVAANWLDGDFVAAVPNQKWAGDITYVWTSEGWLYLAVILDLHSRRVVGWAVSDRMKKDLAIRALDMAVRLRNPPPGCLFHSDRGSQYCSYAYQKKLQAHGLRPSMSGKGNCYDNASVETFFKSLKAELIWRQRWPTRRQAEAAIFQYINGFYNSRRRHSYLGGISPLAFETKVA